MEETNDILMNTEIMARFEEDNKTVKLANIKKDIEMETHLKAILKHIGEDVNREGLLDTPKRVVKMWKEIFRGYNPAQKPKVTTFMNGSDGIVCDEMITDTGSFYSHCEHHLATFFGNYYFGVVYHPKGKILGISKVARIVDFYSAKLQIQERLVSEIANCLWKELTTKEGITPIGMGLVMEGEHLCKSMRGVKKKGNMRTTKLMGGFKTDLATRQEFLSIVNNRGN